MIIDFHTHLFPDKIAAQAVAALEAKSHLNAHTDGTEAGLYASMCGASDCPPGSKDDIQSAVRDSAADCPLVDISVVLPVVTNPQKTLHLLDYAGQLNARYAAQRPRIISFAGIHPDTPDYKAVLAETARCGFKGIKLHPDYQNTFIDDIRYENIIARAEELGLITVIHAGIDVGFPEPVHCPPERALVMLNTVQPQHVVLAHLGGWQQWNDVERVLVGQNVYFDTAFTHGYISETQMTRIIKSHGAGKILFATDSPWSGQRESIQDIRTLSLTASEKEAVLGGNAARLLGIQ